MIPRRYLILGFLALAVYVLTEYLRTVLPQPPKAAPAYVAYWFFDLVFLRGKMMVLAAMAFAPVRRDWNGRMVALTGGFLLMLGSYLELHHPVFLVVTGLCFGAALKLAEESDKLCIVMVIGGLGMGVPLNGFTGLMAAKAGFQPELTEKLFASTLGIGSVSIATAMTGLYLLGTKYLLGWRES